jgi:hypothetical protein
MADIDENIIAVLKADSGVSDITTSIHINVIPDNKSLPYIWIQMADRSYIPTLHSHIGPTIYTYEIDCVSNDVTQSKDLQAAVNSALDGTTAGTFGDQKIAFLNASSQNDTYVSKQGFGDDPDLHISSITIEVGVDGRT